MTQSIFFPEDYTKDSYSCRHLVVGTGAGGSVAGALLTERGEDVIMLEEGGYFSTESYTSHISEMTAQLYRDQGVFPFLGKPPIAFAEGSCVGGGTVINGGLIWRTPSWILEEWRKDHGLEGYGTEELTKHFETIERDMHVVTSVSEGSGNMDSVKILKASEQLGWKYVMVPRAVKACENKNLCPTGCPTGAKQSTLENYLPRSLKNGGRIFTRCRAVKIVHAGKKAKKVIARVTGDVSKHIEITCDNLVLAGGAVQTPHLLRRSGFSKAGQKLEFHMNLKVVARYNDRINAECGTIFTIQVQEFEREGMLITASNMQPHYLAAALSHYGNDVINAVLNDYEHMGIFALMIRPKSVAHITSRLGNHPLVSYHFEPSDLSTIKIGLRRASQLLFRSGALELYLPIIGSEKVRSLYELDRVLENVQPDQLEIITVHVMASCPMGSNSVTSLVNPDGKLWNMKNISVADASILPSSLGTSPQGTIMAFIHEIIKRQS